jgi:hypothetical protein
VLEIYGAGPILERGDLLGKVSGIEEINAVSAGAVVDLNNSTAADIRSILGISSGSGTLVLRFDSNDSFSADSSQFTSFDSGTNTTTFFAEASMITEIAKVQVV